MIVTFAYQSQGIDLGDWVSLLTLCLTPLAVHIFAGVPLSPTVLEKAEPRWHDRLGLLNPTSIMWRYFAIADRRLRAKSWCAEDMAISNAVIWTPHGWDGSEDMVGKCRLLYKALRGQKSRIEILSASMATTLVVTLQGISALYTFIGSVRGTTSMGDNMAVSSIFLPLAIFGLLRLPAAMWIDNNAFHNVQTPDESSLLYPGNSQYDSAEMNLPPVQFHTRHSWRGILARVAFLVSLSGLLAVAVATQRVDIRIPTANILYTATNLAVGIFYVFLMASSLAICSLLIFLKRDRTTIIPCVNSAWYKIYTGVVILCSVILITIAALETRMTLCGRYTTYGIREEFEFALCKGVCG